MKPKLLINSQDFKNLHNTLGMAELLSHLINSDLFDIGYHEDRIHTLRDFRATILYCNGKKVYLDLWEYPAPTYSKDVIEGEFDLIIKLQHRKMDLDYFQKACKRKGYFVNSGPEELQAFMDKVVPWTFFPSKMMTKLNVKAGEKHPATHFGFFCGKPWKSRGPMRKKMDKEGLEFLISRQALRGGKALTDEQYLEKMKTSKFGIIFHGRASFFTEAKNRREIDYMMLKKPLLLNYEPFYYNPLVPGKHFIYVDQNTDFKSLENEYDIDEIGENGYQWYMENGSPMGSAQTFLQIMKDRFAV